jgi:hypothetical protein
MATVFTQVSRDAVCTVGFGDVGCGEGIRVMHPASIADRGDMVDIHAQ